MISLEDEESVDCGGVEVVEVVEVVEGEGGQKEEKAAQHNTNTIGAVSEKFRKIVPVRIILELE